MEVYILRHGISEDPQPGRADADRALTNEGIEKLRKVLKAAGKAKVEPGLILTSPYRRAVETAELAKEVLDCTCELLQTKALLPLNAPPAVWEELRLHKDKPQVLVCGHEPQFSALTAYLLHSTELKVDFKKGAMIRIDLDRFGAEPHGVLKWVLPPKLAGA